MEKDKNWKESLGDSIQHMKDNLEVMVSSQAALAILYKAKYDALIKIGFTEQQAIEIVKSRGIAP